MTNERLAELKRQLANAKRRREEAGTPGKITEMEERTASMRRSFRAIAAATYGHRSLLEYDELSGVCLNFIQLMVMFQAASCGFSMKKKDLIEFFCHTYRFNEGFFVDVTSFSGDSMSTHFLSDGEKEFLGHIWDDLTWYDEDSLVDFYGTSMGDDWGLRIDKTGDNEIFVEVLPFGDSFILRDAWRANDRTAGRKLAGALAHELDRDIYQ